MTETLKSCPWCGKPGRVITPRDRFQARYQVVCANAVCTMFAVATFASNDREAVVQAWNNRVEAEVGQGQEVKM